MDFADLADLIAAIDCLFQEMKFYSPNEDWGYHHPAIVEWMKRYGFRDRHDLTSDALFCIYTSLRKRLDGLKDAYRLSPKTRTITMV